VKGVGPPQFAPTGSLKFGGYDWGVRMIESDKGGATNLYNPENAWHRSERRAPRADQEEIGSRAEIFLNRSLGHDTAHSCELNA